MKERQNAFSFRGFALLPLTRSSARGPRCGLRPQTPRHRLVLSARHKPLHFYVEYVYAYARILLYTF